MLETATPQWTRESSWRQGHVLTREAAQHFGLSNTVDGENTCVAVISHDCDLANDNLDVEPFVEVIVGRVVPNANGNFTWGKAPRTLHYPARCADALVVIELVNTSKRSIRKDLLAQFNPDSSFIIDGKGLAVLRSWLASRYNRAAFPDAFVSRMRDTKADNKLVKVLQDHGELISFVYFDLDAGQNVERKEGDPYRLSIVLVFNPGEDAETAAHRADAVANAFESALHSRLLGSKELILASCFSISEDDLRVSQARILSQWRLEYMTQKADDAQLGPPDI